MSGSAGRNGSFPQPRRQTSGWLVRSTLCTPPRHLLSSLTLRKSSHFYVTPVRVVTFGMLLMALFAGGCSYSFTSGLPSHIKSVAVPLLANETTEFGVAEEITDQLIAALVKDGTLRVVADEADANSVLMGTIRTYSEETYEYTRDEQVDQLIIRIGVQVRFMDRVRDEVLWESPQIFGSAVYDNSGPDARDTGLQEAVTLVVDEILSGIVAGW